jgi:hypothetical protein
MRNNDRSFFLKKNWHPADFLVGRKFSSQPIPLLEKNKKKTKNLIFPECYICTAPCLSLFWDEFYIPYTIRRISHKRVWTKRLKTAVANASCLKTTT